MTGVRPMRAVTTMTLVLIAAPGPRAASSPQEIPPRPEEIRFPPAAFEPPRARDYRHELPGGVTVYLAPSAELPLIDVSFTFRGGSCLDPAGREGLVAATAAMMRRGGTADLAADALDEEIDYLAARAGVSADGTRCVAGLNCLSSNFQESLDLFMDMLRRPRFQEDRFDLFKEEQLEQMKQRNDHPASILRREWQFLLYGREHFEGALPTAASLGAITPGDLRAMHARIFHPGNLVVAASGDFDPPWLLARLAEALEGWEAGPRSPEPPAPRHTPAPGVYHVEKAIPQGWAAIGLPTIRRDDPDYFPMLLANRVLGGAGFTSRITSRVRSDEGLAYSARSSFEPRVWYPGDFQASFQSKNRTVARAASIVLEEIERLVNEPVSEEELRVAADGLVETFPRRFESKPAMLAVFVDDQITGRNPDFWAAWRDRVRAVTPQDVQRVAGRYLQPAAMAVLIVGPWDQIAAGEGAEALARAAHLPLRDPLTLE